MPFVVDASMTMTWCFEDEATPVTEAVLDRFQAEGVVVPAVWPVEVANSLVVGLRRGRLTEAGLEQFLRMLEDNAILIAGAAAPGSPRAVIALAREHGLTAYDASYLELALREGLPLATLDAGLRAAAARAGVPLL